MRVLSKLLILGLSAAVFAAGLLLYPQFRDNGRRSAGQALARTPSHTPVPVVTARVTEEPFSETLEALGTAKAAESVAITPTVEERVVQIFFDDGDRVEKGQVLVALDDSEIRHLLAEAKAALKEQQNRYERTRRLAKTQSTSAAKLDEEQSLLEMGRAKVALLESRLRDYAIRAPFDGILGIRRISTGAVVDSDTVITTLDDTEAIKLDFTVPERYLALLQTGMAVSARSAAYPERDFQGRVTAVSSRVDPETRTVTVRAQIPNPDLLLKPGMLLAVDLLKERSRALVVPEEAVILEKDRKFALVVTPESTVEKTEIVTGRRSPGKVEVLSGLRDGHRVIVQGITRVRPGGSVNVVETIHAGALSG